MLQLEFQANGTVRQKNGSETKTGSFRRDGQTLVMGVDSSTKEFAFKISDNILTIESNKGAYSLTNYHRQLSAHGKPMGLRLCSMKTVLGVASAIQANQRGLIVCFIGGRYFQASWHAKKRLDQPSGRKPIRFRCSANKLEVKRPSEQSYFVYKKTR